MADLAHHTSPFNNDPINIPGTKQVGDPAGFVEGIFVDRGDHLFRSGAVSRRDAVFEIARNGLETELFVADQRETATPTVIFAAKAKACIEICKIVDQFVER